MWQGLGRRRFPRADLPCRIIIFKKGEKNKFSTHTENIGAGGVCVVLNNNLDRFSLVDLVLYPGKNQIPIECEGRVVWVVKSKERFDTGIEFVNIKKQDAARIERIVQECLKKEQA